MKIGFNVLPLKSAHKTRGIGVYTRNLLESLKAKEEVEILEFERADDLPPVNLVHYPFFDLFFHTLPLRKKFPTVVTIHDVMPLLFPEQHPVGIKGQISLLWQKLALKNCKKIITVSEVSKKDIVRFLKVPEEKLVVIYEAANTHMKILSEAENLRIKRKFNLPDQFLLYVGDANYIKNLPFLINGFYKLKRKPQFNNIKLALVGGVFLKKVEDTAHLELKSLQQVNRLIAKLRLEEEIIRPGQIDSDHLVGFYNLATAYVQPSLYEGFGLPILEAMACGVPVVSSNAGSLPEVGGDAPIFFDPKNLEQFVKLVTDVLQSRSLQDKLSKLGLKRSRAFSWEKVADETIGVYKQVTNIK